MRIVLLTSEEEKEEFIEAFKASIPLEKIHRYLPFAIKVMAGSNWNHILVDTVLYPVITEKRIIQDGESLCGRYNPFYRPAIWGGEPCQGCLAVARGLAVRDIS
jgi:hypothetical protein